jgi:hypothetical protein
MPNTNSRGRQYMTQSTPPALHDKPASSLPVLLLPLLVATLALVSPRVAESRELAVGDATTTSVEFAAEIASVNSPAAYSAAAIAGPADDAAESAVGALSRHVKKSSSPAALRTAFLGYYKYRDARPESVRNPYLYFVDLGLDNRTARGYVFDMNALELVDGPFPVAHGRGSSPTRDGVPTTFSNKPGSYSSSLGLYLAGTTYRFSGKSGGTPYTSVGLRLHGESGTFNDAAMSRGIVAHGAPYVTGTSAGRSEGCPAMEQHRAAKLLPLLANGGVVFLFSPHDQRWLKNEPWLKG